MKWSPEDRQAQRRRKLHDVGSKQWLESMPEFTSEEE
jgi:hypothetical protein